MCLTRTFTLLRCQSRAGLCGISVIKMPIEPNYDNNYIQIKLKPETHRLLRQTAEAEFGSENVPWSIVLQEALEQFDRQKDDTPQVNWGN